MKPNTFLRRCLYVVMVLLSISLLTLAQQAIPKLQMAELTKSLQLTEQQQKQLAPIVAERDKKAEALMANKSMGKLRKLKAVEQMQAEFRISAAKVLNPDQVKKLEALQAERRAKLMQSRG